MLMQHSVISQVASCIFPSVFTRMACYMCTRRAHTLWPLVLCASIFPSVFTWTFLLGSMQLIMARLQPKRSWVSCSWGFGSSWTRLSKSLRNKHTRGCVQSKVYYENVQSLFPMCTSLKSFVWGVSFWEWEIRFLMDVLTPCQPHLQTISNSLFPGSWGAFPAGQWQHKCPRVVVVTGPDSDLDLHGHLADAAPQELLWGKETRLNNGMN